MKGNVSQDVDMEATADEAWGVFGTLRVVELICKVLSGAVSRAEVDGDGGVGTVISFVFASGNKAFKEKIVALDNEKRIKEVEVIQGGLLDLGFKSHRVRFEIMEKNQSHSIIKSTIEYEIDDEHAEKASVVDDNNIGRLATLVEGVAKCHLEEKANAVKC
ncbi:S-norcoclaurine synthase-like isoform X2 [Asparagus officinalis]|uniref:S-norcoclaurine synthase-like isoform X2 n=1 Tax=Asparagus officinalis TaxID=4686 RepID=UPI00098E3FCB|nr:S-norcoclaurine synthase-like isoform X2 [Asparagus officinalis]